MNAGGGDVVYHSSVSASQGSLPALVPRCALATAVRKHRTPMAVVNAPPADLKDDDAPLLRLKKERFNAALNEAKARFDLYNRGLTRIPELIDVGERLFSAEVDL